MHQMLQNVSKSLDMREIEVKEFDSQVKAYAAETQRISAVQASMSPEQIQDIVMGTVHGMITSGDLVGEMPGRESMQDTTEEMPQGMPMQPQGQPMQQGMPT